MTESSPTPADALTEGRRIAALRSYDVLDTLPEEDFNDIVRLASSICGTPMALISLVDEDRQWFKAKVGLEAEQTPRAVSFCAHAIRQRGLFTIPDAAQDDRFADNPLVTGEPDIRFYAGAPLLTPDGCALGTLCVLDSQVRALTGAQQDALAVLSRHVMAQMELRRRTSNRSGCWRNTKRRGPGCGCWKRPWRTPTMWSLSRKRSRSTCPARASSM